jgi:hypothetical protein
LDRVVASPSWSDWFPDAKVQLIVSSRLDHCPIFLNLECEPRPKKGQRLFRYEIMWEREETLPSEIQDSWEQEGVIHGLGDVAEKLSRVRSKLRRWSMDKFGGGD